MKVSRFPTGDSDLSELGGVECQHIVGDNLGLAATERDEAFVDCFGSIGSELLVENAFGEG